ncbi:MAG: YkgJ family cysteine cluster protein [Chitinophagaceae bacterium]|nr:YkgJ family cysteine cluster protein [Chitinophagaceae bacterium]
MVTDLKNIALIGKEKENENELFIDFLQLCNSTEVDEAVVKLNAKIEPQIDCTTCGNCCKTLMVNVTEEEAQNLALHLNLPATQVKEQYLEEGLNAHFIMKSMLFLHEIRCSIYENSLRVAENFQTLNKHSLLKRLFYHNDALRQMPYYF